VPLATTVALSSRRRMIRPRRASLRCEAAGADFAARGRRFVLFLLMAGIMRYARRNNNWHLALGIQHLAFGARSWRLEARS